MSVSVRPYRTGGWLVDVRVRLADGSRYRDRKRFTASKSVAQRWGQERERHLLQFGLPAPKKEVPTLRDFAPRFMEGHARANRQKPSGIAAKEMLLRIYLVPFFGRKRLDVISNEDVQRFKQSMTVKAPKTVNNALTVLSALLKKAAEWNVIDALPCRIQMLPVPPRPVGFHDFADYERLVDAARLVDTQTHLIVLLGGDAGLRCGEMIALEWGDVDAGNRHLCVSRSDWNGQVTSPKGGRARYVPLTNALVEGLRAHRHRRGKRVLCADDGSPLTRQQVQYRIKRVARTAGVSRGVHILRHTFCSHLAMRGAAPRSIQALAGHSELGTTQRYMHLSEQALDDAIRLLDGPRGNSGATAEEPSVTAQNV
jgi:integrase